MIPKAPQGSHPSPWSFLQDPRAVPAQLPAQEHRKRFCFPWQINIRDLLKREQKVMLVINKNLIKMESDNTNEVVL